MKKQVAGVLLLLPVVFLAACSGGDNPPPPKPVLPASINISGDLTLDGAGYVRGNLSECAGAGPYADLAVGAPVTVSSALGKPLAIGQIQYSVGTNVYRSQLDECIFRWSVPNVPRAMQYLVTIGRQKPYATTFADMLASGGLLYVGAQPPPVVTTTTTTLPTSLFPLG